MAKLTGYIDLPSETFIAELDDVVYRIEIQTKKQEVRVYIPVRIDLPVREEHAEKLWRSISNKGWKFKKDERGFYYVMEFSNHLIPSEFIMRSYKSFFEKLFHTYDVYDTLPF